MVEIKKNGSNELLFRVKGLSGVVLLRSVIFSNMHTLNDVVENLIKGEKKYLFFERKTNFEGKFLFNVKNKLGELIGNSAPYSSEAGMENGINNFKKRINFLSKKEKN